MVNNTIIIKRIRISIIIITKVSIQSLIQKIENRIKINTVIKNINLNKVDLRVRNNQSINCKNRPYNKIKLKKIKLLKIRLKKTLFRKKFLNK